MKVRELGLRNYRVFAEHPPFKFADRFTVVAGVNGRGKTALLDGLAILCSRFLPHVLSARIIATTHSPFVIQALKPGELINLDPDELGEYADKSIEDIAENVMGVDLPQKSERYRKMMATAEEYYRLLRTPGALPSDIEAAEQQLNMLSEPFSDDPAFQALLKIEREIRPSGGGDAAG